ncbi:MAG TPA: hypothetical protein VGZ25_12850, partial [Gemmataceae bacterium]|nr:hypothetical protein [Gemmataceae bacterium]
MSKVNPLRSALLFVLIGCIGPLQAAAAGDKPPLDELLKAYREWELPLPPKDALLIRYETGLTSIDEE